MRARDHTLSRSPRAKRTRFRPALPTAAANAIIRTLMTWWESWFGEEYLDLYPHRDLASARREAAFALAHLPEHPAPVLDLCCGTGRHSIPLAEAGAPPVGLDYSAPLLDLARRRDRHTRLVRGDMRALPFRDGSLPHGAELLHELRLLPDRGGEHRRRRGDRARAPAGRRVSLRHLRPRPRARAPRAGGAARRGGDKEYRIRRSWDASTSRLEKEIEVHRAGSSEIFRESVRAYAPDELIALLERAGLRVGSVWGDFDESPLGPDSPRLIVLARKAEKPS